MIGTMRIAALALALSGSTAWAESRDLCPDRPGLDTPPCTVDRGRLLAETGALDWTRDKADGVRTDTILVGDTLLRYGLTDSLEAELEWTPYGQVRARDLTTRALSKQSGTGDVTLALKQNLRNPDGEGFSVALLPYATLPTGGRTVGAGDWGAGLLVPVSVELTDALSLIATPEIDAAVDEDRGGRHLAWGTAAGLQASFSDKLSGSAEVQLIRDDDPSGHSTEALVGGALAWKASDDLQLDAGSNVGLNHDSPDVEVYVGVSRRF